MKNLIFFLLLLITNLSYSQEYELRFKNFPCNYRSLPGIHFSFKSDALISAASSLDVTKAFSQMTSTPAARQRITCALC